MLLIVLSIIVLITAIALQNNERTRPFSTFAKIGGAVMLIAGVASACVVQIEAGQVGVPTLFGKVSGRILNSGLNLVNPFVVVKKFDIRTQNYTMAGQYDEGDRQGEDAMRVLTSDGLELLLDVSVLYRVLPAEAPKILSTIGENYEDIIVRPIARTKIRDNATSYTAIDLYSIKREEYQQKVFTNIEKEFRARGMELEQMLVRNITLPESVKTSIESKIQAEQDAQKMEFILQKETQEAERKRVEAQGISDYQRIVSQTLTNNQLQYEMIKAYKELSLSGNSKVIIMGDMKGGVPIILNDK